MNYVKTGLELFLKIHYFLIFQNVIFHRASLSIYWYGPY